jgi:hypothetical protein
LELLKRSVEAFLSNQLLPFPILVFEHANHRMTENHPRTDSAALVSKIRVWDKVRSEKHADTASKTPASSSETDIRRGILLECAWWTQKAITRLNGVARKAVDLKAS